MTRIDRPSRPVFRRNLSVLLLMVLIGFPAAVSAQPVLYQSVVKHLSQGPAGRFTPADCMFDLPLGLEAGTIDCGYLEVPEEYDHPEGGTIRLAVAIFRSNDPSPRPDPLVMLQGGPGGSTIDTYSQVLPATGRLLADRDIILFDQRGTLYSEPALTCPEFLDLTIETLDQDLSDEESNRLGLEALRACRARLAGEGINLSAFDSLENAADVEALRVALGYDQINLYGVSYGTLLAHHVLRMYPEGLRSVILDSVVTPQTNFITGAPQAENRAFEALFAACAEDPACNEAYPNLRDVFYELVDRLNVQTARLPLTDLETGNTYDAILDGDTFLSSVFQMMYATELIPYLPGMIYDVRAGDIDFLARIMSIFIFDRSIAYGMYYSVLCAEDADIRPEDIDLSSLPPQIVAVEDNSAEYLLEACAAWDVETLDNPVVDAPVQSDVPVLLLSGAFDPITPPAYADQAAETLSNSFHYVFPAGGHGAAGSGECQDQVILDFLADPTTAPDAQCVEAMGAPVFLTPDGLVRLPMLPKLLNLQDGTGPQLAVYLISLLVLLTALVMYPLVWLVRKARARPAPSPAETTIAWDDSTAQGTLHGGIDPKPALNRGLYRLAPWFGWLTALALLIFTAVLIGILFSMIAGNDTRILLGLPGSARPLFLLPLLAALLTLLMLAAALSGWARRAGSVWGRLYLTLMTLAAATCLVVLGLWGMLQAIVA